MGAYASPYYNTHTRLRGDGEFGIVLLRHVRRNPELQRTPLKIYLNPLRPKRSVLAPGIPLLAVYQLLVLLAILVPAVMALSALRDILKKRPVTRNRAVLIAAAFLFYFFSIFGASIYIFVWGYLLRSMPPAWPLLVWLIISAFLCFYPAVARRLYGHKIIRRGLYLNIILGLIPLSAIAVGLALPYVIAATVAIVVLTVLIKPFARAGNTPLYALLISLFWVPIYTAGLLAPSRALVQLLHEILPYMPYNIDAVDSERLVVGRGYSGFFSTPLWQVSQGKIKPEHGAEDIFFLTDSKEQAASRRIMKGLWQVWAWAFLWIAMSLAMFHFQQPCTRDGYALWSVPEIIKYAAPPDRLAAVLDFVERTTFRSENQDPPLFRRLKSTPLLGPFIDRVNKNLQHAQLTEGVNFLWQHQTNLLTSTIRELLRAIKII